MSISEHVWGNCFCRPQRDQKIKHKISKQNFRKKLEETISAYFKKTFYNSLDLNKHTVFVIGKITYITDTEEKAIELAEKDMKYIHPKFNLEISGTKEEE